MKTSLSYNLLQHLRRKQAEGGFTLIELLVVIIIIGILAAIALPSFLNQANRARESEAANYIGAANRGQQAYYLEFVDWAEDTDDMDVGIEKTTDNYAYGSDTSGGSATSEGNGTFTDYSDNDGTVLYALPKKPLKGFAGTTFIENNQTGANLCREPEGGDNETPANAQDQCDTTNYEAL